MRELTEGTAREARLYWSIICLGDGTTVFYRTLHQMGILGARRRRCARPASAPPG